MIESIISYVIAFFSIVIVGWLGEIFSLIIIPIILKMNNLLKQFGVIVIKSLTNFASIYFCIWLLQYLEFPISYFMTFPPLLLYWDYDKRRIREEGIKNPENQLSINIEKAHFVGRLVGFALGYVFLLRGYSIF